jgi:hypothetical protein
MQEQIKYTRKLNRELTPPKTDFVLELNSEMYNFADQPLDDEKSSLLVKFPDEEFDWYNESPF